MTNKIFNRAALVTSASRHKTMFVLAQRKFEFQPRENTFTEESIARHRQNAAIYAAYENDDETLAQLIEEGGLSVTLSEFKIYVTGNMDANPFLRIVQADTFVTDGSWMIDFIAFPNPDYQFLSREDIGLM